MELATITGVVVCTRKSPGLEGVRLLWAEIEDVQGRRTGEQLVVADATQAGVGQRVHLVMGREGTYALPDAFVPVDAVVIGIVDVVEPLEGA